MNRYFSVLLDYFQSKTFWAPSFAGVTVLIGLSFLRRRESICYFSTLMNKYINLKTIKKHSFLCLLAVLLSVFICINQVSAMQVEPQAPDNSKNRYLVTCDNGEQHTIIADPAEQDFQYHYPDKGYFIKYYDMEFESNADFAEWVCRNK